MITKTNHLLQSLLVSLLLFSLTSKASETEWQLVKDKQAVQIYKRTLDNKQQQVKAQTQVKASLKSLVRLLDDTEVASLWIARSQKVEIIDWFGDRERLVHSYFASPWPLENRDMVTFSRIRIENEQLYIDVEDRGQQRQLLPHYVRMQKVNGQWHVRADDNKMVTITYIGSGKAGGGLPNWLSNKLMRDSMFETFTNMRNMISLDKYQ